MLDRGGFVGQYLPLPSPVHRLDPRAKLLLVAAWGIALFWLEAPGPYAWLLLALLACFRLSRIPVRHMARGLRPMLLLLLLTLALNLFFIPGKPLVSIGPAAITEEGVRQSLVMGGRMLSLLLLALLLTSTTSALELTLGLEALLAPLARVGFPVHEFALMVTIALRFIPTLFEEFERIVAAQQARGARLDDPNLLRRFRLLLPICIPLFHSAFRRAEELGVAMDARGFVPGATRTRYRELRWGARDLLAALASAGLFLALR